MATERSSLYGFNHGIVDRRVLSHVESKRAAVSAQTQVNWISRVIGHMSLRPGLGLVGAIAGNPTLPPASAASILMEDAGYVLREDGFHILME
jgi:hypothetical protein